MAAKVTVKNTIGGDAAERRSMVAAFAALDEPETEDLILPWSPADSKWTYKPQWTQRAPAGAAYPSLDWTGNDSEVLNITTVQSVRGDDALEVERTISWFRARATQPTRQTQSPSRILVSLGNQTFVGCITAFSVHRTFVDDAGNARVASLDLTFTGTV